jgi:hypothetical protein
VSIPVRSGYPAAATTIYRRRNQMNTRTIAVLALIIAVIVLLFILL